MLSRLLLIASLFAVPACGGSNADGSSEVVFETLDQSSNSGVLSEQLNVVRDTTAWAALWAQHTNKLVPPPTEPTVDFSRNMVLAVFLGSRPSGCYSVAITRVLQETSNTTVEYHEVISSSQICTAVVVYPSHLVAVPAASAPVQFVRK